MTKLDPDLKAAAIQLVYKKGAAFFKVGRCAAKDFVSLNTRPEYKTATAIHELVRTTRDKAPWIEEKLIQLGWKVFPSQCLNDQLGGGPLAAETIHVIYLVELPHTDARVAEAKLNATLRQLRLLLDE